MPVGNPYRRSHKLSRSEAEQVATGAARAEKALNEGSLTAKIKAKMALDDTVKALTIDVDTKDRVVTLTGSVHSEAERAVRCSWRARPMA